MIVYLTIWANGHWLSIWAEHSLEHFFQNTMSNNNPGTCVCVGIAPQFICDLYRILLIFINMQIRRFFYRSMT